MRFVIIGGGGFIGSHLGELLLASGHKVNIFDRPSARYLGYLKKRGAEIYFGDFLTTRDVDQAILNCDVVFHLVSTTVPKTSTDNPVYDIETNILGTLRLLDAARKAQVGRIVFASSGGTVYGIPQEIPIKEEHPTDPISPYGIGKLMIEKYLHLYLTLYKLDYRILRIANAYGERQPVTETQGVIATFLDKAVRQEKVIVWGDGSVIRDYIYAGDIANALVQVSLHPEGPRIFNIGGGQGYSLNDIINIVAEVTNKSLQPEYRSGRLFDVPINLLDISRAKTYLGWQPTVGLFEGISRTYKWMLEEGTR